MEKTIPQNLSCCLKTLYLLNAPIYIYIYIYICVCVCVCVCAYIHGDVLRYIEYLAM